jgi:hypothetical protein
VSADFVRRDFPPGAAGSGSETDRRQARAGAGQGIPEIRCLSEDGITRDTKTGAPQGSLCAAAHKDPMSSAGLCAARGTCRWWMPWRRSNAAHNSGAVRRRLHTALRSVLGTAVRVLDAPRGAFGGLPPLIRCAAAFSVSRPAIAAVPVTRSTGSAGCYASRQTTTPPGLGPGCWPRWMPATPR